MKVKDIKQKFRFFTIKYWKDYIRLRHILKCIKSAKRHFIKDRTEPHGVLYGICTYLGLYLFEGRAFIYDTIKNIIPIFTPQFFNSDRYVYSYWWDIFDVQSRIDAFDKLINHYEKLIKDL